MSSNLVVSLYWYEALFFLSNLKCHQSWWWVPRSRGPRVTDSHRNYYILYFIHSQTLASTKSSSASLLYARTRLPICTLWNRVPKTLEFQKLSSSKNSQVPKAIEFHPSELEFRKLSSSKNSRVPKTLKFQKLSSSIIQNSSSKNSQVPKTLKFQKLSSSIIQNSSSKNSQVPKTLKFQKLSSSKNSQVPKTIEFHQQELEFHFTSVFHWIEFHQQELEFHFTSEFHRTELHHSELQFHITSVSHRIEFHHSELEFQNYFWVPLNRVPSIRTRVPFLFLYFIESSSITSNSSSKILLS